jgi:hypothetical protein
MGMLYFLFDISNNGEIYNEEKNYHKVIYENADYVDSSLSIEGTVDITEQKVILTVQLDYARTPVDMVPGLDKNSTKAEDYLYKPADEEYYKTYHTAKNKELVDTLHIADFDEIYISSLTPFIEYTYTMYKFDMNKDTILNTLNKNDNVKKIYVQYVNNSSDVYEDYMLDGTDMAGGVKDVYLRTYTGEGVTVGILELGVIDTSHVNFQGRDVTIHNQLFLNETASEHATMVASLIGGNEGIANEVRFLSSQIKGGICEEVDWLVENGADIINMSFGTELRNGIYGSSSAYVDYAARVYNQIFVTSSGNTEDITNYYIGDPGLAFNAVTVGAVDTDHIWQEFSCYEVASGPIKPTVMAKGFSIIIKNFSGLPDGTSLSAAFVTGLSAMIFERIPELIDQPMKYISLMTSGATRKVTDYWYDQVNNFDEQMGAGLFNYQNIIDNYVNAVDITTSTSSGNTIIYREEFTLNEGDTIHASIAWMSFADEDDETSAARSDYDIRLMYDGLLESVGCSTYNNIEMVTFTAPYDDSDFTIMVIQYGSTELVNEKVSFSYNITLADEE